MGYIQMGAHAALGFREEGLQAGERGVLHHGQHVGCTEDRKGTGTNGCNSSGNSTFCFVLHPQPRMFVDAIDSVDSTFFLFQDPQTARTLDGKFERILYWRGATVQRSCCYIILTASPYLSLPQHSVRSCDRWRFWTM